MTWMILVFHPHFLKARLQIISWLNFENAIDVGTIIIIQNGTVLVFPLFFIGLCNNYITDIIYYIYYRLACWIS